HHRALTLNRRLVTAATESLLQIIQLEESIMKSIGVDLHSNSLTACYLSEDGTEQFRTFPLRELAAFQESLCAEDQVAVEATGNTRWFVKQIKALVSRVVVVNPNQFAVIRQSVKKTDKHGARALALFLQKGLLPEARLKSEACAALSSLCQTRQMLVELRTTLVNKLHAIHRSHGIESKKSEFGSEKGLEQALAREWSIVERVEIEVIVSQIRSLNESLK